MLFKPGPIANAECDQSQSSYLCSLPTKALNSRADSPTKAPLSQELACMPQVQAQQQYPLQRARPQPRPNRERESSISKNRPVSSPAKPFRLGTPSMYDKNRPVPPNVSVHPRNFVILFTLPPPRLACQTRSQACPPPTLRHPSPESPPSSSSTPSP